MRNLPINSSLLKRGVLYFWAVWFAIVFLTNFCDGAKALGALPDSWTFASGNFQFLGGTTARYHAPSWLNGILFAGVIAWEALAACLFFRAGWRMAKPAIYAAFTASLGLFGGFIIADEILIAYAVEETHLRLFIAHLATLLTVELLP